MSYTLPFEEMKEDHHDKSIYLVNNYLLSVCHMPGIFLVD